MIYVTQVPANFDHVTQTWTPRIDLAPLREFGDHKVLLPPGHNFADARPLVPMMTRGLVEFDPRSDYLLALGDPLVMAVAMGIVSRRHPTYQLLKWDRFKHRYEVFTVLHEETAGAQ